MSTLIVLESFIKPVKSLIYKYKKVFPGSARYWEERYAKGGNSGSGSYNRLAEFKAEILNAFVAENGIQSVLEFGCGDGNQLTLVKYPKYMGFDVAASAIRICMNKFQNDNTKSFFIYNSNAFCDNQRVFYVDLALSLDVIFHLVEDAVFNKYMEHLFNASSKYVIIYASNIDGRHLQHERHRKFSNWVVANRSDFELIKVVENKYKYDKTNPDETSLADFYIYRKKD